MQHLKYEMFAADAARTRELTRIAQLSLRQKSRVTFVQSQKAAAALPENRYYFCDGRLVMSASRSVVQETMHVIKSNGARNSGRKHGRDGCRGHRVTLR
jgi:hypothetical protein